MTVVYKSAVLFPSNITGMVAKMVARADRRRESDAPSVEAPVVTRCPASGCSRLHVFFLFQRYPSQGEVLSKTWRRKEPASEAAVLSAEGKEVPASESAKPTVAPTTRPLFGGNRLIVYGVIAMATLALLTAIVWPFYGKGRDGDLLYVPSFEGMGLIEINPDKGGARRVAKTSLYNNSLVATNPVRRELYVAATNGGLVSVVDPSSFHEVGSLKGDVGWNTWSMVVSGDGKSLFLGCSQMGNQQFSRVVAFDLTLRRHVATALLSTVSVPVFLALSSNDQTLYAAWNRSLDAYDAPNLQLLWREKHADWNSAQLLLSFDGLSLFLLQSGKLSRWRTDTRVIDSTLELPEALTNSEMQVARDGGGVFVSGSEAIYRIPASLDGYSTIRPPKSQTNNPYMFTQSTDGRTLYVLSGQVPSADLWEIDVSSQRLIQIIKAIPYPTGIVAAQGY